MTLIKVGCPGLDYCPEPVPCASLTACLRGDPEEAPGLACTPAPAGPPPSATPGASARPSASHAPWRALAFGLLARLAGVDQRIDDIVEAHPGAPGGPCPECYRAVAEGRPLPDHVGCRCAEELSVLECERLATIADYGTALGVPGAVRAMTWAHAIEEEWYTPRRPRPDTVTGRWRP